MVTRERSRDRGSRRSRATLGVLGRELRDARRGLGLRQSDIARAAGISPSWVSRIERQEVGEVGLRLLCVLFATVGLDMSTRVFPGGAPLRDDGHRQLLARVRALLPADAHWRTEVPVGPRPDQRAWDARTRLWGHEVAIEAELRPMDLQALERRLMLKTRDGDIDRLVLALADTRRNRALIREVGVALRGSFPIQGRPARAVLHGPIDPGCNLLIFA